MKTSRWEYVGAIVALVIGVSVALVGGHNFLATRGINQLAQVAPPPGQIYVDGQLSADCPSSYNLSARSCGDGTAKAFNSLQEAADIANPGDQILLRGGTIQGAVLVRRSGTASQPIIFQPYNNENVTIQLGDLFTTWVQSNVGPGIWELDLTEAFARGQIRDPDYVKVVQRGNYGIADAGTMADLINAPVITTGTGKKIDLGPLDLAYFDQSSKKLYLRLVNSGSWNPQNFFVFDASKRLETFGSYITFRDLTVEHGFEGFRTNAGVVGVRIINNTIQYMASNGVMKMGGDLLLEGNKVSYVGREVHAGDVRYGGAYKWGQVHGFYLTGRDGVVRNNILRECKGSCLHPWNESPQPDNYEIYGNTVEGGFQLNGKNMFAHDNLIKGGDFPVAVQMSAGSNIRFWNNVLEGDIPLSLGYFGAVTGFEFKNNLVRATGNNFCVQFNEGAVSQPSFANNYYADCQQFGLGSNEAGNWRTLKGGNAFADYAADLRQSNSQFEVGSLAGPVSWTAAFVPKADSALIDAGVCLGSLTKDRLGNKRPQDGNGDGVAACDIGPVEVKGSGSVVVPPPTCTPNWSCGTWSVCANQLKTRTCTDLNRCLQIINKPSVLQSCDMVSVITPPPPPDDDDDDLPPYVVPSPIPPVAPTTTPAVTGPTAVLLPLEAKMAFGLRGEPVKHLQVMLAQDAAVYTGPISGYYDTETKEAVARFQAKQGIPTDASSRGLAGPITRAKLNALYAGKPIAISTLPSSQKQAVIAELQKRVVSLLEQVYALLAAQAI